VRSVGIDPAWTSREGIVIYDPNGTQRALERLARAFEGTGVPLAVENWRINPEREEFLRLARALGGAQLGILLDLGHLHVMTDDPAREAAELPLAVREVHVSDNDGNDDDHLPLGRGTLPVERIARSLFSGGFDGVWTLEIRARYNFAQCSIGDPRARKALLRSRELLERALARAAAPRPPGAQGEAPR
jgi:sugar phosphate isomerase/epimerase